MFVDDLRKLGVSPETIAGIAHDHGWISEDLMFIIGRDCPDRGCMLMMHTPATKHQFFDGAGVISEWD